jgi:hypothetical protein
MRQHTGRVTATAYADTEADYDKAAEQIPVQFERLEKALEKQGADRSSIAPTTRLQRYLFLDRVRNLGHLEKIPAA